MKTHGKQQVAVGTIHRAVRAGAAVVAVITLISAGCGWPLGPRPRRPQFVGDCRMSIRFIGRPEMQPLVITNAESGVNPFSSLVTTRCSDPAPTSAVELWSRFVHRRLSDLCATGATTSMMDRMTFCERGDWCQMPGRTSCPERMLFMPMPGEATGTRCLPIADLPALPLCPVLAPPPDAPRIAVMPASIEFNRPTPATLIGSLREEVVTVSNAGSGTLRVGQPVVVPLPGQPPMAAGSFAIAARSCGPAVAGGPETMLTAGDTCGISVRFQGQAPAGAREALLRIPSNDAATPSLDIRLSGISASDMPSFTCLRAAPGIAGQLCFNVPLAGGCRRASFTLRAGLTPLVVRNLVPPSGFTLVAPASVPAGGITVGAGMALTVTVQSCLSLPSAGFLVINSDSGPFRVEIQPPTSGCTVPPGCM